MLETSGGAAASRLTMPRGADWPLTAALGALYSLAFVHTAAWPLQLLIVAWLASRLAAARPWRAAGLGLLFGSGWLIAGTWWLFISMHRYGGLPAWLAALAVAALSSFLSLYLAAAFAAFARWRSAKPLQDAALFAALWLLAELARGVIFTGFPWVASGYAFIDSPLAVLAPWVGVYGLGAVASLLSAWIAFAMLRALNLPSLGGAVGATVLLLIAGTTVGPGRFTNEHGRINVTLLQGNVAQDEKFAVDRMPEALAWTADHLLAARGDLVIGPETVIPLLPEQLDPDYWNKLAEHFRAGQRAALLGLPLGNPEVGYTNSAAGITAASASMPGGFYRYDKHHLVPFGEFIPTGFHWFTELMNIPLGDFNRGPLAAPPFAVGQQRVAANICYEDLFGEELAARFDDAANAPTLFANISNIGWFGDTIAIDQHLNISRMRTLEFQLPMLRATNTGATVVIDHTARVTASLAPFTQGVLDAEVEGREGRTPFAWWAAKFGLWPLWLLGAAVVVAAARSGRRIERR